MEVMEVICLFKFSLVRDLLFNKADEVRMNHCFEFLGMALRF